MALYKIIRCFFVVLALALSACDPPVRPSPPVPTPTPGVIEEIIDPGSFEVEPGALPSPETPAIVPTPVPIPSATPPPPAALIAPPPSAALTRAGYDLIVYYEVGGRSGYDPHPEAPDARISGITWGLGYDGHYNKPAVIIQDWAMLKADAKRLAEMHPYYGPTARSNLHRVKDIFVSWAHANDVFARIDVAREFASAKRYIPGFIDLRPNAQAAIISLGFNRGWSMVGSNRLEMRAIRDAVPDKDYATMAVQFRRMIRVWRGTSIERGMTRRRYAEAKLIETP